mmetsp:Transcript_66721/g.74750  ORF Transcript_66721/g.74750 Transcript_66721/m.74750 type:complete len:308 (-) Transcript_66721:124-1047(-)
MDPKRKNLPQRVDMTGNIVSKRRSSVKMAKRQSYKVQSAEEDGSDKEGGGSSSEKFFQILGMLMFGLSFVPIVLGFAVSDFKIAVTAGMVVAIFNMCFSYFMYKKGKTRSWPKILDICLLVINFIQTVTIWTNPETADFWRFWSGSIVSFFQCIFLAIAWVFGYPFTKTYVEDEYGLIGSTFPFLKFAIRVGTSTWVVAFFVGGLISLPGGILQATGKTPSDEYFRNIGFVSYVPFILAILICFVGLPWYLHLYEAKIFKKYETEIMAWYVKYPDEKFTKMYEEEMEAEKGKAVDNSDAQENMEANA